jgi:hypothetical protein
MRLVQTKILGMCLLLFSTPARADWLEDQNEKPSPWVVGIVSEGLAVAVSAAAANEPRAAGIGVASLLPVAALGSDWHEYPFATALFLSGAAGISAYNISIAGDDISKRTLFGRNIAGWNALGAVVLAVGLLEHDPDRPKPPDPFSISITPTETQVVKQWRF